MNEYTFIWVFLFFSKIFIFNIFFSEHTKHIRSAKLLLLIDLQFASDGGVHLSIMLKKRNGENYEKAEITSGMHCYIGNRRFRTDGLLRQWE